MTNDSTAGLDCKKTLERKDGCIARPALIKLAAMWLVTLLAATGCQTQPPQLKDLTQQTSDRQQAITLREGDILRITFPGTANLNTPPQQIRRDGRITLPLVGEVKAAGMTPAELEKELIQLYSSQLESKQVTVTVESSSFPVFVTGAVIKPGKISSDHPITALEAIMEAGGPNYTTANLKAVTVIRQEAGQTKRYTFNLKRVLQQGEQVEPFYLKPYDIVYVREKFAWF